MKAFDREEQELMESIEEGEWVSVENIESEIKKARETAKSNDSTIYYLNERLSGTLLFPL